jgi:hypothetical protein
MVENSRKPTVTATVAIDSATNKPKAQLIRRRTLPLKKVKLSMTVEMNDCG